MKNLSILLLLVTSLSFAQDQTDTVVTIAMIGDVIENVGGECVTVTTIMGAGVDPHLYQASARDVQTFNKADIIFYSGYALEGQLGKVLERFSQTKPTVAVAPASIPPSELITVADLYGIDPHLWMDVSLWANTAATIADELSNVNPECSEGFISNAETYKTQLLALHDWITESIASIPETQRLMVTAHDAFAYYGRAYDIEVTGIQGISTESEAGIADIRDMASLVAERNIPAVFIETTINPRTIQAVVDAAAQQGHEVTIGKGLYSDAMGEDDSPGSTYIGMLYTNTVHITEALGGELPPLPEALLDWANAWNLN